MWTKEDIATLATLWETSTKEEIANKIGITPSQVGSMVARFKKVGYKLPRKHSNTGVNEAFLIETLQELGIEPAV